MVFNSLEFLIYFPIVLLLNFALPKKYTWVWLLAVSYWFYMAWNPELIVLIMFTTVVSYLGGIAIEKSKSKSVRRFLVASSVILCLLVLFFFKYYNFISDSLSNVFYLWGGKRPLRTLDLILPVGISFYTFQTLSYTIDVYRGSIPAERHFGYYALFVTFFPQLVAGPIERPENLLPQIKEGQKLTRDNLRAGLRKMTVGYFKKVVVADILAVYVDKVFNSPSESNGLTVLVATVLFAFQIYCDFAGYTDIAIGCARIMGIRLMQNFNLPYTAKSIREFWSRWHISLSSWFRDYLYIPLGGSRCSKFRHCINLMIVFLVSGLWHGASWHFVIWGGLHGFYQVTGMLLKKPRENLRKKLHINENGRIYPRFQQFITFILVDFAWLVFRANNTSDMILLSKKLFTDWSFSFDWVKSSFTQMNLTLENILICISAIVVLSFMDRYERDCVNAEVKAEKEYGTPLPEKKFTRTAMLPWVYSVWAIAIAWLVLETSGGSGAFIYFQF